MNIINIIKNIMLNIKNILSNSNLILMFVNILFFIVVQILFFKYIASLQFNKIISDKVNIINETIKWNWIIKTFFSNLLKSDYYSNIKQKWDEMEKTREQKNNDLILSKMAIIIIPIILIIIFFIYRLNRTELSKSKWNSVEWVMLLLILFAYSTELLFFFFIVKQYEFVGDHSLFYMIYKNIRKIKNID